METQRATADAALAIVERHGGDRATVGSRLTGMDGKPALFAVVAGCSLAGSGIVCLCVEAWLWMRDGQWHSIPIATVLTHLVELAPRSPSGVDSSRLLYWFLDLPLHQGLMAAGLGLAALGLALLR